MNQPSGLVDAGSMRKRVGLMKPHSAADGSQPFGVAAPGSQQPYTTVWASIKALSGRDLYKAQQFVSDVTHLVSIRYRTGVESGDWVLYNSRKFRVQYPENPEERNIRLDLFCLEVDDGSTAA